MPEKTHEGDLASYPKKFLRCRGGKLHPWRFETDASFTTNTRGRIIEFRRIMTCPLCEGKRISIFKVTPAGKLKFVRHVYDHQPGYRIRRTNPISPEAVQDAMILNELETANPELLDRLLTMRQEKPTARRPHLRAV